MCEIADLSIYLHKFLSESPAIDNGLSCTSEFSAPRLCMSEEFADSPGRKSIREPFRSRTLQLDIDQAMPQNLVFAFVGAQFCTLASLPSITPFFATLMDSP